MVFSGDLRVDGNHRNRNNLLRVETDVEEKGIRSNVLWPSEGEEEAKDEAERSHDRRDQEDGVGREGRKGIQFRNSNAR